MTEPKLTQQQECLKKLYRMSSITTDDIIKMQWSDRERQEKMERIWRWYVVPYLFTRAGI